MLEMLLNPKRAERRPWELFFVGFFYAAVSLIFVEWLFSGNPVFSKYSSLLVLTFTVMLSLPFVYFVIKREEEKDFRKEKERLFIRGHSKAIAAFLWLFFGFVLAFSLFYILFPEMVGHNFQAQIEQYCVINMPTQLQDCITRYGGITSAAGITGVTGEVTTKDYAIGIFVNNIYVLIFCLIFSILFGAGAIFILAWNATVIATAVGIFAHSSVSNLPAALARYLIHGVPEIAAYFIAALAGGIISIALIRHDVKDPRFWNTLKDSLDLILLSIGILVIAMLIEVFVTPRLF